MRETFLRPKTHVLFFFNLWLIFSFFYSCAYLFTPQSLEIPIFTPLRRKCFYLFPKKYPKLFTIFGDNSKIKYFIAFFSQGRTSYLNTCVTHLKFSAVILEYLHQRKFKPLFDFLSPLLVWNCHLENHQTNLSLATKSKKKKESKRMIRKEKRMIRKKENEAI